MNLSQGLVQTRSGGKKERGIVSSNQTRSVCVGGMGDGGEEGLEFKYLYKTKNF